MRLPHKTTTAEKWKAVLLAFIVNLFATPILLMAIKYEPQWMTSGPHHFYISAFEFFILYACIITTLKA